VVMLLAAGIVLLDSGFALLMVGVSNLQYHVVSWAKLRSALRTWCLAPDRYPYNDFRNVPFPDFVLRFALLR
jgi:hypothetical protein